MRSACVGWTVGFLGVLAVAGTARAGEPVVTAPGPALRAEARVVSAGDAPVSVYVKAVFRNEGEKALTFFLPEFFSSNHFPGWRLVREDGVAFRPYDAPFQSMWTEGVQGSLSELTPGKSFEVEHTFDRVVPADERADEAGLTPLPIEPGRYLLECAYEKEDAQVPVGRAAFALSSKTIPGLWTGRVEAPAILLEIPRPKIVTLRIDAKREAIPGTPYPLTVVLTNGRDTTATLLGALRVSVSSKPRGTASAHVRLAEPCVALAAGQTQSLTLAPGESKRFTVDLGELGLAKGGKGPTTLTLASVVEPGIFVVDAAFETAREADTVRSNLLWRYVRERAAPR